VKYQFKAQNKNEFNKWFDGFRLHIEKAHGDKDKFDDEESFGSEDDDDSFSSVESST